MRDEKVVSLSGAPVAAAGEVSDAAVEAVEDVLARVKSGDVQGVVILHVNSDETVGYWCAGTFVSSTLVGTMYSVMQGIAEMWRSDG